MKVIIKDLPKNLPGMAQRIKRLVIETLRCCRSLKDGEITVSFVGDSSMRELNLFYAGMDKTTDVLAFDLSSNKKEILADIIISTDTAKNNARTFKTGIFYEIYLYVIHGVLHLLGYHDRNRREKRIMQQKAERILACLSIKPRL